MRSNLTLIAAAAALSLVASAPAFADQGAGDPFPFRAPAQFTANAPRLDTGSQGYQRYDGQAAVQGAPRLIVGAGREGTVESVNALPAALLPGVPATAYAARPVAGPRG